MQRYFLSALFGFLFGVFCQNLFFTDIQKSIIFFMFISIVLCNVLVYWRQLFYEMLVSFILCGIGMIYAYFFLFSSISTQLLLKPYYVFRESTLELKVDSVYNISDYSVDYLSQVNHINGQNLSNVYAILRLPKNYELRSGDTLITETKIYGISPNPQNLQKYYMSRNIFFRVYPYDFSLIYQENQSRISQIREKLLVSISRLYPKEEAIFLSGILLGARESLPKNLKQHFNNSGLTHIIAVSGFNITILIIFCSLLFFPFPRTIQFFVVGSVVVLFVLLVGASMPVLRAALMGLIGYLLMLSGRQSHAGIILLVSLVCIVCFSPLSLNYDVSLQLSFFAVLGIFLFYQTFKGCFLNIFLPFIADSLAVTFAAMIFTLPLSALYFGQISLVAPLTNLLVVWNIPLIMLFGSLSLVTEYFFSFSFRGFSYLSYIFLHFDIDMVHFFGKQKWSVVTTPFGDFGIYFLVIYIVFTFFLYIGLKHLQEQK